MPNALELLKQQAADRHPRVRLEAIRAASFFKQAEAVEVVLISADQPADLARVLQISNPKAVGLPNAYLDRDIPRRAVYARMWEEVKAS